MKLLLLAVWVAAIFSLTVEAQPKRETLRGVLGTYKLSAEPQRVLDLDRAITSYAVLDTAQEFLIAYYVDDGLGLLRGPIHVARLDRGRGQWTSALAGEENPEGVQDACDGSVLAIRATPANYFLDTHINPSAGCLLLLTRELKFQTSLLGWFLANLGPQRVLYHRNEIHFAPVHAVEIGLYDTASKKDFTLYPSKPYQSTRLARIEKLRPFFASHTGWCSQHNHPCDPETFNSALVGEVAVNEKERGAAFRINYENDDELEGKDRNSVEPTKLVVVCRNVGEEATTDCRELLLSDVTTRFGDVPLQELLTRERLLQIFGN